MDWKLSIFLLQIFILIINAIIFLVIKLNDLKHLNKSVNNIEKKLDKVFRRLGKIEKKQIARDAICEERHTK